jgi:hypothetical protein
MIVPWLGHDWTMIVPCDGPIIAQSWPNHVTIMAQSWSNNAPILDERFWALSNHGVIM